MSHSSKDKYYVNLFEKVFEQSSTELWIDHNYLAGGDRFPSKLKEAISASDTVILLWSQNAANSQWVTEEYRFAIDAGTKVIPCRLDNAELPPGIHDEIIAIDFSKDIVSGLEQLWRQLNLQAELCIPLKELPESLFASFLKLKLRKKHVAAARIPGLELRIYDDKLIRWKRMAYSASAGLVALSRDYMRQNYGNWLEDLFRRYLREQGWEINPSSTDHRSEVRYRALTVCNRSIDRFCYVFSAEQNGSDWSNELYMLDIDYYVFFQSLVDSIDQHSGYDNLLSDDFVIRIYDEAKAVQFEGQTYHADLAFYYDIADRSPRIEWFDQLLSTFLWFLEQDGYDMENIGFTKPPLVEVTTAATIGRPIYDRYLYRASKVGKSSFRFLYEAECIRNRKQGYAKISILR